MSIDLYYMPMSSPCRAVMLTAEALGINLNHKILDFMAGENTTPEYEQMNPQKTVPFMVDDGYSLAESRAIMCYLADQYGDKYIRLYPRSIRARALVHQRMNFDASTLYPAVADYYYPVVFRGQAEYSEAKYEKLKDAFGILEKFLEDQTGDYCAGVDLTIADLALIATISSAEALGFELDEYKNVAEWADRVKSSALGYSNASDEGLEILKGLVPETTTE